MANTGNTQQQIDYGAAANDGTGDPLRTAFIKTDDNFDNIWLAGPVGSNITIINNTVQANNTNGNLILSPNGIGVVQTNSKLLPRLNNTYDLGSTALKYRAGYFGAGGLTVDGNVTITGNLTAGNISYTSNVFIGDLQGSVFADDSTIMVDAIDNVLYAGRAAISGNVSATYFIGNGSQLTGLAAAYGNANVVANLAALGSNPVSTTGNISGSYFIGNGSQLTGMAATYGNANVVANLAALGSNPVSTTGNVTASYFIGNGSQLTGMAATYGNSNVTTLLSAFGSNTISGTGNITTTANISGGFILGNVAFANGISTYGNANVVANLAALGSNPISTTGNITAGNLNSPTLNNSGNIRVVASGNTWTFGSNGNLTIPGNIIGSGNILIAPNSASASSYLDIYLTGGPDIHIASNDNSIVIGRDTGANIFVGNDGEVSIRTDNGVTSQVWNFDDAGNLTLPGNTFAVNYANGDPVSIGGGGNTGNVTFNDVNIIGDGNLHLQPDPANAGSYLDIFLTTGPDLHLVSNAANLILGTDEEANVAILTDGNVAIQAGNVGGTHTWNFGTNGNLTAPGNISAVGNITGAGNISAGNVSTTGNVTAANFFGNGNTLSNVATTFESTWTVPTGNSTQSFTVPINNTYQLWVLGNIPNGIIVYNATVSVSNTNVPVVGQQFAWNYEGGGNILMFTSIPAQIVGTAGTISNAAPAVANTNVFSFGINNTSGNTVTVNYGYTKIS